MQKLKTKDELAILKTRLLMKKEHYIGEKARVTKVRDSYKTKVDREYFQGHIDAIEGFIDDLGKMLE